jgi:hypothetical protein
MCSKTATEYVFHQENCAWVLEIGQGKNFGEFQAEFLEFPSQHSNPSYVKVEIHVATQRVKFHCVAE